LIAADEEAGDFIAAPALKDAAEMLSEEPTDSLLGRSLGRYEVIALLGRGGMGEVYLAYDPRLERKIALKLLPGDFIRDEVRVRRFMREARAVSALNHPNIITIYEIGEANGRRYIATEFIEGQTLRQRQASGRVQISAALEIAIQAASALGAAHKARIVHRDIKPENIMLRPDGLVKVLDFGLAKLTEHLTLTSAPEVDTQAPTTAAGVKTAPGTIMGTVAYMSPEQARGWRVDARSDIFSLGVVCYEMIAGRMPFTGETSNHIIVALLEQEPAPLSDYAPDAPAELQRIISKALRKDREKRYQSIEGLLADLKALKQTLEIHAASTIAEQVKPGLETVTASNQPAAIGQTTQTDTARPESAADKSAAKSAKPLARPQKSYRPSMIMALATIMLLTAAGFFYFNRAPVLTEKDTILLADFVNQTGDEVFDHTLKQALAVMLEQTPFLSFFPEERIRETLRYMGRAPNERVTKDLAREICQRRGVKALLIGSIARFDRNYSITLEAFNSQTGETIASALTEAEGKDQVLQTLGKAATQLRERLGESLSSIQQFDAPLEQATTSSLEAFKAWTRGGEMARSGQGAEAIPLYKRAKELDPNFAKADVSLSVAYINLGQLELAAEHAAKAFDLRGRVTEREKFDISTNYYALATGDLLKAISVVETWRQTYPRDYRPHGRLVSIYRLVGQFEKSLAVAREANRLDPGSYVPYVGMGTALVQLNRFDEAQKIIEQALAQQLGTATSHRDLYQLALIKGDAALMSQQIDWAAGRADEYWASHWQAQSASFAGRMREANVLYERAAAMVEPRNPERAAWFREEALLRGAACGLCQPLKNSSPKFSGSSRISVQSFVPVAASRAIALALCGESGQAQTLADEAARINPQSTLANVIWLPVVRAAIEIERGHAEQAIQLLQLTNEYEQAALFWPTYLRGLAYLRSGSGKPAAVEFQKILDHRGWDPTSTLYPLAHLGLARAAALTGDAIASRRGYQDFLTQWKDADADLPISIEAKREFERLKRESTSGK
jgi:serine/threonine protein kinase/Flp pilus assembly protein TadD